MREGEDGIWGGSLEVQTLEILIRHSLHIRRNQIHRPSKPVTRVRFPAAAPLLLNRLSRNLASSIHIHRKT